MELTLEKVSLLFENSRHHFCLIYPDLSAHCQLADGNVFITKSSKRTRKTTYHIEVRFTGGMFGLFRQWLIFDFGDRPVLMRELTVELGRVDCCKKVRYLRQTLEFDRYSSCHIGFARIM